MVCRRLATWCVYDCNNPSARLATCRRRDNSRHREPTCRIPPSILLVLTGVLLALVPGLPPVELAPDLVLLLVLPPIIYTSAFLMSWREFQFNLRPITLLAVGGVLFTTIAVAAAAHWVMDLPWPIGFVLGAIVSPPDAIAPVSIARRMEIPRRIIVILEGEGTRQRRDGADPLSLRRWGN